MTVTHYSSQCTTCRINKTSSFRVQFFRVHFCVGIAITSINWKWFDMKILTSDRAWLRAWLSFIPVTTSENTWFTCFHCTDGMQAGSSIFLLRVITWFVLERWCHLTVTSKIEWKKVRERYQTTTFKTVSNSRDSYQCKNTQDNTIIVIILKPKGRHIVLIHFLHSSFVSALTDNLVQIHLVDIIISKTILVTKMEAT